MRRALFVAICLSPVLASADAPIIGGTATKVGDFPFTVAIDLGGALCSGELVAPDWVMTAAHCVSTQTLGGTQAQITASVRVHLNTVDINTSNGEVATAVDTFPDPQFNINDLGHNDMGLIHLSKPVTDVTPVLVNLHHKDSPVGEVVTMIGFGTTQLGAQGGAGKEFAISGRTSIDCGMQPSELGPKPTNDNMLCFSQTDSKGQCEGDSGGPSIAMIGGKAKLVAVTSYGDQNCGEWGADTRTEAEKAFILGHIPDIECNTDDDCASTDPRTCSNHVCIVAPFSPGGEGATCGSDADCDAGSCATGPAASGSGTQQLCSTGCTPGADNTCPDGFDCLAAGASGACWPSPTDDSGCCDAGNRGAPTALAGMLLFGVVVLRRRRR